MRFLGAVVRESRARTTCHLTESASFVGPRLKRVLGRFASEVFCKLIRFQPRTLAPLVPLHPRPAWCASPVRHRVRSSHHASGPTHPAASLQGECFGSVEKLSRAWLARTAAGRSWPQVEPFRRPTAIPLDPMPTAAASGHYVSAVAKTMGNHCLAEDQSRQSTSRRGCRS